MTVPKFSRSSILITAIDWLTEVDQSLPWIITSTDPWRNCSLRLPQEVCHCLSEEGVFQARRWRAGSPEMWDSPKPLLVSHSWSTSDSVGVRQTSSGTKKSVIQNRGDFFRQSVTNSYPFVWDITVVEARIRRGHFPFWAPFAIMR